LPQKDLSQFVDQFQDNPVENLQQNKISDSESQTSGTSQYQMPKETRSSGGKRPSRTSKGKQKTRTSVSKKHGPTNSTERKSRSSISQQQTRTSTTQKRKSITQKDKEAQSQERKSTKQLDAVKESKKETTNTLLSPVFLKNQPGQPQKARDSDSSANATEITQYYH